MSTHDDRLAALEQGLRVVQSDFLLYLSESNRQMATLNKVITAQELNGRDIDHNLTVLLGIASEQGRDIKAVKDALGTAKEQIADVKQDNAEFYIKFDRLENQQIPAIRQDINDLHTKFDRLENRFGGLEGKFDWLEKRLATLESRFEAQDKKLDQILLLLNTLTSKPNQET